MNTRFTSLMTTLILSILFTISASAYDVEVDGIYYVLIPQNGTAEVISGDNKYTGEITIPSTICYNEEVYKVTSIGVWAFVGCTSLTSISIPNSVISIGGSAFSGCSSLTSITIPNSVTSIDQGAFRGCSSLTSLTIPNSVTTIGFGAFNDCPSLTSISVAPDNIIYDSRDNCNAIIQTSDNTLIAGCQSTIIPRTVTAIGTSAFSGCSNLTSVTIPNSVKNIGGGAFAGCSSLSSISVAPDNIIYDSRDNCNAIIQTSDNTLIAGCQSTIIPRTVTAIGTSAFSGCSNLTSVTIPNSVISIGEAAFRNCSSLTSVTIPNLVTSIGDWAFFGCSSLTSVTIPNSVISIGGAAFRNCSSLTSVTIPNSVTSIGPYALASCYSLTSLTIGSSVTRIRIFAFEGCTNLENVYCYAETVPNTPSTAFKAVSIGSATLHVPASAIEAYKTTEPWSGFGTIKALDDANSINSIAMRGIAIQTADGFINISGLGDNEKVSLYTIDGRCLGTATAFSGSVSFNAQPNSIVVAKIGKESVKIAVK